MRSLQMISLFTIIGTAFPTPVPLDDKHIENVRQNNLFLSRINAALTDGINHHYVKQLAKRDANSTDKEFKDNVEISVQHFSSNFPFPLSFSKPNPEKDTLNDIDVVKDFSNKTVTEYKLTQDHEHDKKESTTLSPTTLRSNLTTIHSPSSITTIKDNESTSTTPKSSLLLTGAIFLDGFDNSTSQPLNTTNDAEKIVKFVETSTIPSSTKSVPIENYSKVTETTRVTGSLNSTTVSNISSSSTVTTPTTILDSKISSTIQYNTSSTTISPITVSSTSSIKSTNESTTSGGTTDPTIISISVNSTISKSSGSNAPTISSTIMPSTYLPDKTNAPLNLTLPIRTNDKSSTESSTEKLTTTVSLDSTTREARLLDGSTTQKNADNSTISVNLSSTTELSEKSSNSSSKAENPVSSTTEASLVDIVQGIISRKIAEIHG